MLDHAFGSFFAEVTELGAVNVADDRAPAIASFDTLREHADVVRDIDPYRATFSRPVDHEIVFTLETEGLPPKIVQRMRADRVYFTPVEWAGTMPMMNFPSTPGEVSWVLRDTATGRENLDIDWSFEVGDVVKIRLVNDRDAVHAMQHPFHIHGQRFLVLSRNGVPERAPRLERHDALERGRDGGHSARNLESGTMDGALPHRRTSRNRDETRVHREVATGGIGWI